MEPAHGRPESAARTAEVAPAPGPTAEAGVVARAASPVELASLLRLADGGSRERLANAIQTRHGNARFVQLLHGGTRIHGLPAHVHAGLASGIVASLAGDDEATTDDEGNLVQTAPTTSGTTITVNDSTYNVTGSFVSMATTLAGRDEAGSVTSQVSDLYLYPTTDPVRLANITVTESRSLPLWTDRGDSNTAQVAEWDRFRGALAAHEQKHIDIDKATYANVHTKAIGKTHDKANEAIDATTTAANTANSEFDTTTDHGRNQGTKIDTNVGAGIQKVP